MSQQKRNNRRFFYVLVGMLLLIGAIGVASAKQTASIYDAPDLHLVQGSEEYDLMESITYDSDKYELAVKDTGDFDINVIGEYEVSYTLTPKGEAVDKKEGGDEKAQSTEETEVQSAEGNPAEAVTQADSEKAVESLEQRSETAVTEAEEESNVPVTEQNTEEGESVTFSRTVYVDEPQGITFSAPTLTMTTKKTDYDLIADVTAVDENEKEVEVYVVDDTQVEEAKQTETDEKTGEEVTTLKEGTYTVTLGAKHPKTGEEFTTEREVEVTDELYLDAPTITVETGSTDYNLLDGVELRNADGEVISDPLNVSLTEGSLQSLKENTMTGEELSDFIETMESRGEEPAAASEVAVMASESETDNASFPLKEGVYIVELQATDKETNETYQTSRFVVVQTIMKNKAMVFQAGAYKNNVDEQYREGDIEYLSGMEIFSEGVGIVPEEFKVTEQETITNRYLARFKLNSKNLKNMLSGNGTQATGSFQMFQYYFNSEDSLVGRIGGEQDFEGYFAQEWYGMGALGSRKVKYRFYYQLAVPRNPYYMTDGSKNPYIPTALSTSFKTMTGGNYTGWYYDPLDNYNNINNNPGTVPPLKKGDWNRLIPLGRSLPTMQEGGAADAVVTVNKGVIVNSENLDFERMDSTLENLDTNSSLEVDLAGEELRGTNGEQLMPAMQIEIKNARLSTNGEGNRMIYSLKQNTYLRLKGFQTTESLQNNTVGNLWNRQMWIYLNSDDSGSDSAGTLEFNGSDDPSTPDKLYARVYNRSAKTANIILKTNKGGSDIDTAKFFQGDRDTSTMNFTVDAAEGTKIELFNLSNYNGVHKTANNILLKGSGIMRFSKDCNIPDNTGIYSQAYTKKLELGSDVTVLKSGLNAGGVVAQTSPAIRIADRLAANGHQIAAGVNKVDNAEPAEGEVFATSDNFVLDPTDFTVNTNDADGTTWVTDGSWFMANADTKAADGTEAGKQIVFIKNKNLVDYPIVVKYGSTEEKKASYKEALEFIQNSVETDFTVTNLRPLEFDHDAIEMLKNMSGTGKSITFTGAKDGAGVPIYGECYHIRFRESNIELPSGYDITWNQPVKYDEDDIEGTEENKDDDLEFFNNGGKVTFDTKFAVAMIRRGDAENTFRDTERITYVYGGSSSKACAKESIINVKTGKFTAIYGGNKAGKHTGHTTIHLDTTETAEDKLVIGRVDGAGREETTNPNGRTAKITSKGTVKVQNIYSYDELTVKDGTLTIPKGTNAKDCNINAMTENNFKGKTIVNDGATLQLLNGNGIRSVGSLVRSDEKATDTVASLILARAEDADGNDASEWENPYLLTLTAKNDPLAIDGYVEGRQLTISYNDKKQEKKNDIVMKFTGLPENQRETYIKTTTLKNGFGLLLIEDPTEAVIKLDKNSILLTYEDGKKESLRDIAGAIVHIAEKEEEQAGQSYTISVLIDDYRLIKADYTALGIASGEQTGSIFYEGYTRSNLDKAATAAKITWNANYNEDGNVKTERNTVSFTKDFTFFGKANTFEKINFKGTKDIAMYGNGSEVTFGENVTFTGDIPDFSASNAAGEKTEGTITVLKNTTLGNIINFKTLTVGANNTDTPELTVNGKIEGTSAVTTTAETKTKSKSKSKSSKSVESFLSLFTGDKENEDEKAVTQAQTYEGIVWLKKGQIKLAGLESSSFTSLKANDSNGNKLTVPKDSTKKLTYPLNLSEKTELENNENKIDICTLTSPEFGDKVIVYADRANAKAEQYRNSQGFSVVNEKEAIYLKDKNLPIMKIELYEKEKSADTFTKVDAYDSYKEAFKAIGQGDKNKTYKFVNLIMTDFTEEDAAAFLEEKRDAAGYVFEGGEFATYGSLGGENHWNYYPLTVRMDSLTMPSDIPVTWNETIRYERTDASKKFTFYNNGGTLNFGERFGSRAINDSSYDFIVYGGSKDGACDKKVTINVERGQFEAIYGGNQNGTHRGDVDITVNCPTDRKNANSGWELRITRLDGASEEKSKPLSEQAKQAAIDHKPDEWLDKVTARDNPDQTVTIKVQNEPVKDKPGEVQIDQIYNYDRLEVMTGTLTVNDNGNNNHIISSLLSGYKGETVIDDGATLKLLNAWGYRRIGSLVRQKDADVTKTANLYYYRVGDYQFYTGNNEWKNRTSEDHPFVIRLTDEEPFGSDGSAGCKIAVNSNGDTAEDVVFKLTGVTDDKQVTVKKLESAFPTCNLYPKVADKTIRLEDSYVMLVDPSGNKTKYRDMAGAIAALADKETLRKAAALADKNNEAYKKTNYTISFWREYYIMNSAVTVDGKRVLRPHADEVEAMKYASGKKEGTFTYFEQEYPNLKTDVEKADITWDGKLEQSGTPYYTWIELYVAGDLNFFGASTTLDGLILRYDGHADILNEITSRDIYANGKNLTIKNDNNVQDLSDKTKLPSLYGGSTKEEATHGDVANITVLSSGARIRFWDVKDFKVFQIGDALKSGSRPEVRIYGQISQKLDPIKKNTDKNTSLLSSVVEKLKNFIGVQAADEENTVVSEDEYLYMNGAYLELNGYNDTYKKSYVSNLRVSNATNNHLVIPKSNTETKKGTYPLQIAGKTILDNKDAAKENPTEADRQTRLYIQILNDWNRHGDTLVQYQDKANADPNQYRFERDAAYVIKQDEKSLILARNNNNPVKLIEIYENYKEGDAPVKTVRTYAEAFAYVKEKADATVEYTFKNIFRADFTAEDSEALAEPMEAKGFVFINGAYDATKGYDREELYDEKYAVLFRTSEVNLPSNIPVTWDITAVYYGDANNRLEFINNGGELTFGKNFRSQNTNHSPYDMVVYGGAASGTCDKKATINIYAGQFDAVYGGNKKGTHTGDVEINIDCPSDRITGRKMYITRLDGAGREKSEALSTEAIARAKANTADTWTPGNIERDAQGTTAKITIKNQPVAGSTGVVEIRNVFNYDELRVESGTLKIPYIGNYDDNIFASLIPGYKGKTVICDNAELRIENPWSYKRLGSLERQENAQVTEPAKLYYTRTGAYNSIAVTEVANPCTIWLTDEYPFGEDKASASQKNARGCKINVTCNDGNGEGANNEIVFNLKGVKDKKQVTVKKLESSLAYLTLYPDKENNVIRYQQAYISLKDPQGVRTKYRDIAGAITALADKEASRKAQGKSNAKNYEISFFRNNDYFMNGLITSGDKKVRQAYADEREAMEFAAGKRTGTFTYLEEEYTNLATDVANAEITWYGDHNWNDGVQAWNSAYWTHWYAGGDLNFFGEKTTLSGFELWYSNRAELEGTITSRDIYANGSDLTLDKGVIIKTENSLYPSIYGGNAKTLKEKDPKKLAGNITILSQGDGTWVTLLDLKDFNSLTLGDNNKSGRGSATVYGQMSYKLDAEDENQTVTQGTGKVAAFFRSVADSFLNVTGLQEQADEPAVREDKGGELYFNWGYLLLRGYQKSYVGSLKINDSHDSNALMIPKDNTNSKHQTYPLQVAGTVTHETSDVTTNEAKAAYRLYMQETNDARLGDVLIQVKDEKQAVAKHYRSGVGGLNIAANKNDILFWNNEKTIEKIELTKWVEKKTTDQDGNETVTVERLTQTNKDTGAEEEVPAETYRTYAQAFKAVGAGDENIIYQFKNLVAADFTVEDQAELLKSRKAKEFKFVSDAYQADRGNDYNYVAYNTYPIMYRIQSVNLPQEYQVTFDQLVGYEGTGHLEIINNGGTLTFGENFKTRNIGERNLDVIVYGGAESGTCDKDVKLNIYGGQFDQIYGGNKEGKHTGNVEFNISRPTDQLTDTQYLYIYRLDGAGAKNTDSDTENNQTIGDDMIKASQAGKAGKSAADGGWDLPQVARDNSNATTTITVSNEIVKNADGSQKGNALQIRNIFNYDKLLVEQGTLKIPNVSRDEYRSNLMASLLTGYKGQTIIGDEATLWLENSWGYKRMGTLVREAGADATKKASLKFSRVGDYSGFGYQSKDHPFQMELTAADPFEADSFTSGAKITVGETEGDKDLVFRLSGVKDDEASKKKYITLKTLESGFPTTNMYPDYDESTIRLEIAYVMLTDPSGNKTKYRDVAGAIAALADKEVARKSLLTVAKTDADKAKYSKKEYKITFFQGNYVMNWTDTVNNEKVLRGHADELKAMEYAAGKGEGTFEYLGMKYPNLSTDVSQAQITWNGSDNSAGTAVREGIEFYASGDLNFFGTDTTVDGLYLNFSNDSQNRPADLTSRDIYGNGSNLTFTNRSYVREITDTSKYPSLYGGNSRDAATRTVSGGNITIYGTNNGECRMKFYDLKDFKLLTIGNNGVNNRPQVNIYGQINYQLETGKRSVTSKLTSFLKGAVQGVKNAVAPQEEPVQKDEFTATLEESGTVYLNYGYLYLAGYQKSYIANMAVSDSNQNALVIPKDTTNNRNRTYPVQISGKTVLKNKDAELEGDKLTEANRQKRLWTSVTAGPVHGDVLVQYKDENYANPKQYRYEGWLIKDNKNSLILAQNDTKPIDIIEIYENYKGDGKDKAVDTVRTYEEAFAYVKEKADATIEYTFRNTYDADFRTEDAEALEKLDNTVAKGLVFIGGDYQAGVGGTNVDNKYPVMARTTQFTMPSDVAVTWDETVYYTRTASEKVEFINNGGELTFGKNFRNRGKNDYLNYGFIVYGGAKSGECDKDVTINLYAGQFYEIYGGNKEGKHTGNVKINLSATTKEMSNRDYLKIYRLDGATADNGTNSTMSNRQVLENMIKAYQTGRTELNGQWSFPEIERDNPNATVEIIVTNEVDTADYSSKDDFGKENVSISVDNLFNYDTLTVEQGMFDQPDDANGAYNVNTISSLVKGYKGKTVIADGAEIFFRQDYGYRRLGSLVGKKSENSTKTARLYYFRQVEFGGQNSTSKKNPWVIELSDEDPFGLDSFDGHRISVASYSEAQNDIVFDLTGIKEGTEATYTSTVTLESAFTSYGLEAHPDDTTIRLGTVSNIMLIDQDGNKSKYKDIAGAIIAIAAREKQREADKLGGGSYTIAFYQGGDGNPYTTSAEDLLAMKLAAGKGDPGETLTYQDIKYTDLSKAGNAAKITWNGKLNSAGTVVRSWTVLHPTGELNFFGTNTEIDGMQFNYDNYTNGKSKSKDIYGNGSNLTFADLSHVPGAEYPNLYGGSKDKTQKGGDITILSRGGWMFLNDVRDFKKLTLGKNPNGQPTVRIYGTLDSNQEGVDTERTGTLVFDQGQLLFENGGSGHVGNLEVTANGGYLAVYKKSGKTSPLYVDGKTTLKDTNQKLELATTTETAAMDDLMLVFKEKANAKSDHYRHASLKVNQFKNKIFLGSGNYKVETEYFTAYIERIQKNGDAKNTLYYLSKYNEENGEFDKDPDWRNFGTRKGAADVTITPIVQPNGDYLRLDLLKNGDGTNADGKIAGMDENSTVLFDYTTNELKGDGWPANYGWYYIPDMQVTFLRAQNYTHHISVAEPGGTLVLDQCYNADGAPNASENGGNGYDMEWNTTKGMLKKLVIIPSESHNRHVFYEDDFSDKVETVEWKTAKNPSYPYFGASGFVNAYNRYIVDTGENGSLNLGGLYVNISHHDPDIIGTGENLQNSTFELKGTGSLWMNTVSSSGGNIRNFISTGTFTVTGEENAHDGTRKAPTLVKGRRSLYSRISGKTYTDSGALYVYKEYVSNGYRLNVKMATQDDHNYINGSVTNLKERDAEVGEVIAVAVNTKLDATDFELTAQNTKKDRLYLTSTENGTKIIVAQEDEDKEGSIHVSPKVNGKELFETYQDAIEEIKNYGTEERYTISNTEEVEFLKADQEALQAFTSDKVKELIFESGDRGESNPDGEAETRYRVRMRIQTLQLPENVNVKFQNIVMKYDEGTNSEITKEVNGQTINVQDMVFVGNGGNLTFGNGVVFLQHNDAEMTPAVYGGSTTSDLNTDSTIIVTADCTAHFAAIYGGGTRNLTGNTNIQLYGGTVENVYGGGKGGSVTGTTTVNISLPNTVDASTFTFNTISGSGTNEEGTALEDNVTGDKTVTIAMKNSNLQGTLEVKTLAGFTTLNLGDENASYNDSIFKVSDRFDSNAQENNAIRTGTVNLKRSSLTVNSSKQGHIGSMVVSGESELNVYKAENTSPLKVDKTVTVEKGIRLRINAVKDGAEDNTLGDRILEFRTQSNANRNSYVDGSSKNLSVGTEKGYILFKDSTGHDVSSWVEYPGADAGVLIDKLDTNVSQATVSKILHFDYNEGNTDKVRDGYVIAVPKNITEAAEQVKYSKVDSGFCKDGTFSQAFAQMFTEGTNYWKITFTKDADGNGATGVTPAIKIDNQNFIYVAHIVCDAREQSDREKDITTFIVDTSAPKQDTEATKVEQIDQDGATESVTYTLAVTDPVVEQEDLPAKDEAGKTHMTYTPAGIDQVFWAFSGEKDKNYVNAEADAQAAQREAKVDQPDGTGLNGTGTATADGKIELTISKAKLDKAKKDGKNLWVYVKDGENNTMKMMLNLDENVINVRVPLNVNVVAVKKAEGGDCELLAPNCYVVNDGSKEVTAAVNGFTTKEAKNLKLVKDKAADQTYGANEIALQLMPSTDDQTKNTFDKTNVLTLGRTNMLNIGTMQPKDNEGRIIGYTFDAAYNVKEINVPDEWISNTMSYHFTVKN